jgi:catechol-2,3-dioxygenase
MDTNTLTSPEKDQDLGIRPAKLAHVVLRTDENFEEVANWYRGLLNAKFVHKDQMSAFMTYDDEHHRVAVIRAPGLKERPFGVVGLEHFAFTFANLEDLLLTYERLKGEGIVPVITINHGATTSIYYHDPDRNRVELQVDNFADWGEFAEFIQSGAMKENPIGVKFDPDQMLADLRAGVPAAELQAYKLGPIDPEMMEKLTKN